MSEVLPPSAITSRKLPTLEGLEKASVSVRSALGELVQRGDLLGATSFGSFASDDGELSPTRVSDLDWLIVFKDTVRMLNNEHFGNLLDELSTDHIPFHNPILSAENIRNGNHMISSLLYGIEKSPTRVVIGKDPLTIFQENGVRPWDRKLVSKMFSTLPRYFIEDACIMSSRKQITPDQLAPTLQSSMMYFRDIYRTMFVLRALAEDSNSPLPPSFEGYAVLYRNKVSRECLERGMAMHAFQLEYRERINLLLEAFSRTGNISLVQQYGEWLAKQKSLIASAAEFCQENINLFYSESSKSSSAPN